MTSRLRNIIFSSALAAVAAGVGIYAAIGDPLDPFDNRRFSAAAWKDATAQDRARMSRDLMLRHLKPGMSKAALVSLLGDPVHVTPIYNMTTPAVSQLEYYLGSWTLYRGMDHAFLCLELDPSDQLVASRIDGY
jgi:hypothetical protein